MKRRKRFAPRVGMYARVLNAVPAYNEANRQPAPMLTDDTTVTVKAVDCASMRLRTCDTCGRKHETFVLVEWLSREWPGITERASVHPCNLMEWAI